jgi:hypothetical protein
MTPEVQKLIDEKVAAYEAKLEQTAAANVEPLPGPLKEAFGVAQFRSPLRLRPVVQYDMVLLRKLQSPLFKHLEAQALGQEAPKTEFSDEEGYEMLYLFTIPCKQAKQEVEALGADGFKQKAFDEIATSLSPAGFAAAIAELQENFINAFTTAVRYQADVPAGGKTVFTTPPADTPTTG